PRERTREDSHHSSARARTTKPERLKVQDRLRYGDRHVLDRLGHRRQSAFDRLSETYSPSTTKSRPRGTDFEDHPRGRSRPHRLDTSNEDRPKDRERFRSVGESYDDSFSHSYRDGNRSRHMKRRRDNESPLSSVLKSDSSDGRYQSSRSKRHNSTDEDDLTRPWMCEEEDPFTPRIRNFESSRRTRMPNNVKTYDGTGDPEDHVKIFQAAAKVERWAMPTCYKDLKAAFLAYFMQQKKYVKDPVEIHNIKQKDGETIEDFIERFKVEIGRIKGAPECMRISGFMHGVNNPELTKRLNEHVPKTMEEMMITTTAFIQGEAAAASKKKGHASWKAQDQSKRQNSYKRSDFWGHSREGRGSNRFTPLTKRQKRFLRPRRPATNPRDADATPRVNIQEFCEEYYEDILPIIMDKVRRDRRKDVHTKLDFGEGPRERTREDSHHSSARARTTKPERLKVHDRLRYGDRHVLDRLGHRWQSAFDRLSETYSPSTTKSRPRGTDFGDHPRGRSHPHRLDTSNEDCPKDREHFRSVGESYDDSFSHSYRDGNRSHHMKRRRDNKSPLSSVSKSDSSDGRYQSSRSKRHKSTDEDDLTRPWMCEEEDLFTPRIRNFESSRRTRMPNNVKTYDGTGDPEDHVKIFQAAAQVERWAMPTWYHMFNSTLIGAAMLTKRLNERVPKTMEEMMITTTAFIRGEAAAASKKKGHASWKAQDQSKRQNSYKRSDFWGHSREGRGSNWFTPLTRTPKEILAAEAGKFQPPPPMVTPVEKRNSNKFCDFHNDKGHSTDECMQLKKQIEELVRAGKLSHLIKEIKHGRDQSKTGKNKTTAKDKPTAIYMIQSWQKTTRQKEERTRPDNFKVGLHPDFPDQEVAIEGTLLDKGRIEICSILKKNLDIFAWQPSDMTGVPRSIAEHQLTIREGYSPVRQKKKGQAPECAKAIQAECFLDAYKGYHQIQLAEPDEEKIAFHTGQRLYCYTKMPFGLKNAGATYQRLTDKAFKSQIVWNIEVYVDDLVVKSYTEAEMLRDINETFRTLRKINMKLNPKKYTFGLAEGVFLGYVVTPDGIKPCSDKTADVLQLPSPRTIKEVQRLNGKLASLNRFLSKSAENSLPLFKTLKKCIKKSDFHWTAEAEQAFKQLKQHLSELPLLAKNVGQRTDLSGFSYRDAERKPTSRASGRNSTRAVDTFHERLIIAQMGVKNVHVSVDSKLVANQVLGTYVAKEDNMVKEGGDNRGRGGRTDLNGTNSEAVVPHAVVKMCWTAPAGPFLEGPCKVKFLIVAMDYFTKWIEAKAVVTITGDQVKKLVWDNIVCRFGLPGEIFSDNGKQFSDNPFKDWCDKLNITQRFASVKHPQSNGLVERANQSLGEGIKARLGEGNKNWVEELPYVLWAHRTMIKSSHGDTSFSLTYGTEAVIPTEIGMPTPGDFVYRSNDASHAVAGGKLGPKWEGPYEVTEALGDGAYKLRSMDGTILSRTWNIANLKRCYL
nr:reverse transcriptase domain-containing protein [Tanacetum cinerariifolium]